MMRKDYGKEGERRVVGWRGIATNAVNRGGKGGRGRLDRGEMSTGRLAQESLLVLTCDGCIVKE